MSTQPTTPTLAVPASSPDDCKSKCHQQHFVDDVFPLREVHLIAGASGAGKTTMIIDMIRSWQTGESWFGHVTHSLPVAYISLDRSRDNLRRVFDRMGIKYDDFPAEMYTRDDYARYSKDKSGATLLGYLNDLHKQRPHLRVFIVEAIQSKIESKFASAINDDKAVSTFLQNLGTFCQAANVTILGIVHTPKLKKDDEYSNPRERIKGSTAWAAYSETVVLVEPEDAADVTNARRNVWILPRNAPQEVLKTEYKDGHLLLVKDIQNPVAPAAKTSNLSLLIDWFRLQQPGRIVTHAEMLAETKLPEPSLKRERNKLLDANAGLLSKAKHGTFRVELADEAKIAKLLGAADTNWLAFQAWLKQQPVGRVVSPDEIADESGIAAGNLNVELFKAVKKTWLKALDAGRYEIVAKGDQVN